MHHLELYLSLVEVDSPTVAAIVAVLVLAVAALELAATEVLVRPTTPFS